MNNNELSVHDLKRKLSELESINEGLREANFVYQKIFERLPFGLQIFDKHGFSHKINTAQKEMLGLPGMDSGIGTFNVLSDPYSIASGASELYKEAYLGIQKSHEFEYDLGLAENQWETRKDKRTFKEFIIPVVGESGVIRNVVAVLDDVTPRKLLQESENKHGKVINSITSAFYFYRLNSDKLIFTGANPAANKIIGISHEKLIGKNIEECFPLLPSHIPALFKNVARGDLINQSFEIEYEDDRFSGVYLTDVFKIDQNEIAVNFIDITERKISEKREAFLKNILETLNKKDDWTNSIKTILTELKSFSKFDAIGIRFEMDNDYPYYVQEGFSDEFLKVENSLCSRCSGGSIVLNSDGNPDLECTCGLVLSGSLDLSKEYATPLGSFWTNYSKDLLDLSPEDEPRRNPRNTCIHHGYMSVLLVPLKNGEKIVGLLQMNNKESNKFSPPEISFYEEIGSIIGIAYEKILDEQALKDNEELFSSFMDHLQANIYIKNTDGRYIYANKALKKTFGSIQWNNKSASEILNKEEADRIVRDDLEVIEKGQISVEDSIMSSDGRLHEYQMQKFVIERSGKTPLIGGISFDVTEHNILVRRNIENEERWKFALEGNQDGVWDWNLENNAVYFSVQWKAMLGFLEDEIEGNLDEWSKRVHPDDLQKVYHEIDLHLKGETPFYSNIHRVLCKDGSFKWILDRGKIVKYSEEGKPARMIGTHTDLTKRMQLENQLKELNSTKDKLFSIIGHDLRNPIGNIVNFSELLKKDCTGIESRFMQYIGIINSSAEHSLTLLEDLLLWSKTQARQVEFKLELLRIDTVFREVFEILNPNAILKKIIIKTSYPEDLNCYADRQMLKVILRNLLQNAIKFTNPEGLIVFNAVADQNSVRFIISDNGIGMDGEIQSKIFKVGENVTNYGTSGEKGSGMGLILCREFVEKHGGAIWAESEVGKGSKFYFTLLSN